MKKIIALFVLFFAFSINASAQDKSIEFERNAKKDLELMLNVIKVNDAMVDPFYKLFIRKYQELDNPNMTPVRRSEITSMIDAKLRASLTNDQIITLEKNKDVYAQLIASTPAAQPAATTTVKKKK